MSVFIPPKSAKVNFLWGKMTSERLFNSFIHPQKLLYPPKQISGYAPAMGLEKRRKLPHGVRGGAPADWFMHISSQKEAIWNTLFSIFERWWGRQTSRGPGKLSPVPLPPSRRACLYCRRAGPLTAWWRLRHKSAFSSIVNVPVEKFCRSVDMWQSYETLAPPQSATLGFTLPCT